MQALVNRWLMMSECMENENRGEEREKERQKTLHVIAVQGLFEHHIQLICSVVSCGVDLQQNLGWKS
jgi:hypothetical protein